MQSQELLQARLEKLVRISIALSAERDLGHLLDMIVYEARALTNADGGTLYLVQGDPSESLQHFVMQTESLGIHAGGATGRPVNVPNIPLYRDGQPNHGHICAYAANTGCTVNIPDWRTAEGFDFTGPRKFEESTGYVARSFLVVALRDHEEQIIGVLQLINALDSSTGEPAPFTDGDTQTIEALASQAAVAITNTRLIRDTENLFQAFAEVMASAIDERSPATAGHIKRVAALTLALAGAVNRETEGPFQAVHFSKDELVELRLAALLHDLGKLTTPVQLIEKTNKLEAVYDRGNEVATRFELIKQTRIADSLRQKLTRLQAGAPQGEIAALEEALAGDLRQLAEEQAFILEVNRPVEFMFPEKAERVRAIGAKTYMLDGTEHPYLTADEVVSLTTQRGNITGEELRIMRDHAAVSIKLLSRIPFTRKLRKIPLVAGAHHERLDGKGYPLGLSGDEITMQTRMLTIADIFDALTASDRSYKKPMSPEDSLKVLIRAADGGELDRDLVDLFIRHKVYQLDKPEQPDR